MSETKGLEGHAYSPAMAPPIQKDWKNAPTQMKLKEDLDLAKQSHDTHLSNVQRWRELMRVSGRAKPKKVKGRSSVQPRLIRRQAEWRYSALTEPFLSSDKLFQISPVTFEDGPAAEQNDIVLNWQFRTKLNRVTLIDNYVRANVNEGSAIVRVGWKRITKTVTEMVPSWQYMQLSDPESLQLLDQAIQHKEMDPRGYAESAPPELQASVDYYEETGIPVLAQPGPDVEQESEKILVNEPTVDIMRLENVYIDPTCGQDIDKASFVIVSFETSKAELLKEPDRYKNLDHVDFNGAGPIMEPDHETSAPQANNFTDELRKRVVAYEYWGFWDIHGDNTLVPIVATWIGNTLIRLEENPFPDEKPPFVVVNYMPVLHEMLGEPDAELLEENQRILGAVTRGMIDLLGRSANGQQGFAKGMLDIVNRRRFDNGEDYEFNPNVPPQNGHIQHQYPEIPNSAMNMMTVMNQDAEALTGVKSFSGGMSGEAYGDVAAGIRGVLDAASKREMSILRRMAKGIQDIGRKICSMNAVFLSEEEVIRVTNTDFVTVKREDLAGNFDLKVDISTAEIDNNKAQDLGFLLQTLGNSVAQDITFMILAEIARLKRMPELAHQLKNYKPQPDPMVQQLQQIEIQLKMKELEKLDSEIALNKAKAIETTNRADQIDLDTVEQETGTKHERDMEKQRGQAEGNQNLEVTKSLLKPRKQANGGESEPELEAAVGFNEMTRSKIPNYGRPSVPVMPNIPAAIPQNLPRL